MTAAEIVPAAFRFALTEALVVAEAVPPKLATFTDCSFERSEGSVVIVPSASAVQPCR